MDDETFNEICILFYDGVIGNKKMVEQAAQTSTLLYNVNRGKTTKALKIQDLIPTFCEYFDSSSGEDKDVNSTVAWQAFMLQLPG